MGQFAYHYSIREHLADLAELSEVVGPSELICGWFNDLYFLAEKECPSNYPKETWDRGLREWRGCFTSNELAVLAEFHDVFEQHVSNLSHDWAGWQQDSGWLAVRDAARVAVERLDSAA
jgi:hypothetical protein